MSNSALLRCKVNNYKYLDFRGLVSSINKIRPPLRNDFLIAKTVFYKGGSRNAGGFGRIFGSVGRFLKLRYLLLTGAVGGGVAVNQVTW